MDNPLRLRVNSPVVGGHADNDRQNPPICREMDMTNEDTAHRLSYSAVYSAAQELGYDEQQSAIYATERDLFVADNPDWVFDDADFAHDIRAGGTPDGR